MLIFGVLRSLARNGYVPDLIWLIHAVGNHAEPEFPDPASLLREACFKGELFVVRQLHHCGVDIRATFHSGWTTLHGAVVSANRHLVSCLLWHGVDINAANRRGLTPLQIALNRQNIEVTEAIYEQYPVFCRACAERVLQGFRGWPGVDPVPSIPLALNGMCPACDGRTTLLPEQIGWLPRGLGLPDYFMLWIVGSREESIRQARRHGMPYRPLYGLTRDPATGEYTRRTHDHRP